MALSGAPARPGPNTRTVTNTFDGLGRETRAEVTAGADTGDRPTDLTLDSAGNQLTAAVKKAGVTTTTTFTVNLLDQTMTEARADGSTAKTTYDPAGNGADRCYWAPSVTVGSCYEVGHAGWTNPPTSSTSTTCDARNQRIGLVDSATNETTTYDPDHLYQVKAVYLPTIADLTREHQTLYAYDSRHRLTGITQQLCVVSTGHSCSTTTPTGSDTYLYDDNNNRTKVVEDNGAVSSDRRYCYDALDQLIYRNTGAACSSGSNDEAWTYDDAGNRLTAKSGGMTTNFAYTAEGVLCDVETAPIAASCTRRQRHERLRRADQRLCRLDLRIRRRGPPRLGLQEPDLCRQASTRSRSRTTARATGRRSSRPPLAVASRRPTSATRATRSSRSRSMAPWRGGSQSTTPAAS